MNKGRGLHLFAVPAFRQDETSESEQALWPKSRY